MKEYPFLLSAWPSESRRRKATSRLCNRPGARTGILFHIRLWQRGPVASQACTGPLAYGKRSPVSRAWLYRSFSQRQTINSAEGAWLATCDSWWNAEQSFVFLVRLGRTHSCSGESRVSSYMRQGLAPSYICLNYMGVRPALLAFLRGERRLQTR